MDQAGIGLAQRLVVDAKPLGDAQREVLDKDIGVGSKGEEHLTVSLVPEVERDRAFATVPGAITKPAAADIGQPVALRRFDPDHVGPVIGQHHPGHRPGNPAAQVKHAQVRKHAAHSFSPVYSTLAAPVQVFSPDLAPCAHCW
jgi:hypothetical protein